MQKRSDLPTKQPNSARTCEQGIKKRFEPQLRLAISTVLGPRATPRTAEAGCRCSFLKSSEIRRPTPLDGRVSPGPFPSRNAPSVSIEHCFSRCSCTARQGMFGAAHAEKRRNASLLVGRLVFKQRGTPGAFPMGACFTSNASNTCIARGLAG